MEYFGEIPYGGALALLVHEMVKLNYALVFLCTLAMLWTVIGIVIVCVKWYDRQGRRPR